VTSAPDYQDSVIDGFGRAVVVEGVVEPPMAGSRVLFDVTAPGERGAPAAGLDRAARFLNLAAGYGVNPDEVEVAVVLHGEATRAALHHGVFSQYLYETVEVRPNRNPNIRLINQLDDAGVKVYVCLQALAKRKVGLDQVVPAVTPVVSADTVVANKAMQDYAVIAYR
jgi:hypothetical protein